MVSHFDVGSGVFVSERLLNELNLPDINDSFTIDTTVIIPNQASISTQIFTADGYESQPVDYYSPYSYVTVPLRLQVEGIIKQGDLSNSDIFIPYELSRNLFKNNNMSNQNQWEPQVYILEVKGDLSMDQLAERLLSQLPNFKLFEITQGIFTDGELKVYHR